jgi:hypothetical protein
MVPVGVIVKDRLLSVAAGDDVVAGPGEFDAGSSGHTGIFLSTAGEKSMPII